MGLRLRRKGALVRGNYISGISGEQPAKLRQEICRAFQCFNLNVSIGPRAPWFIHVLVFGPPLDLDPKGNACTLRCFVGERLIIANSMMRLTVTG